MALPQVKTADEHSGYLERLPRWCDSCNDFSRGVTKRERGTALNFRHIQHTPRKLVSMLVFDVDRKHAALAWDIAGLPPPNYTVTNPGNGHAHLIYILKAPVSRSARARQNIMSYCSAIADRMTERLRADRGYAGHMSKNPLHPHWITAHWRDDPYELGELAKYCDAGPLFQRYTPESSNPRREAGRNCALFEDLRVPAYREARKPYANFEEYYAAMLQLAELMNRQNCPENPLSPREVECVVTSVTRWSWGKFTAAGFAQYVKDTHTPEIQAKRGRKGGRKSKRPQVEGSERQRKPWEELNISRKTYYKRKRKTSQEGVTG